MSFTTFPAKHVSANILLPFDFISVLSSGETLTSAEVTISVHSGVDAAAASMISGAASITGFIVSQLVIDGEIGVIYLLNCAVTTSLGNSLIIRGYLAVIDSNPYQT